MAQKLLRTKFVRNRDQRRSLERSRAANPLKRFGSSGLLRSEVPEAAKPDLKKAGARVCSRKGAFDPAGVAAQIWGHGLIEQAGCLQAGLPRHIAIC